jgi:hypothetical protein
MKAPSGRLRVFSTREEILEQIAAFDRAAWVDELLSRTEGEPKPAVAREVRTIELDWLSVVAALVVVRFDAECFTAKLFMVECQPGAERVQTARAQIARAIDGFQQSLGL